MSKESVLRLAAYHRGSLLTRDQGKRVREDILALFEKHEHVAIEFEGVSEITPSFADETLGRLLLDVGPAEFKRRIFLRAASLDVKRLVNKVLAHREREWKEKEDKDPRKWAV